MKKIPKQEYTPEFREPSVKRVKAGQSVGTAARELGLIEQTLRNCWGNAPTESFFNALKNERMHGTRYRMRPDAEADLFDYLAPKKFMEHWISAQHEQQLAT